MPARQGCVWELLTVCGILNVVIELAVAPHLSEEQGNSGHTDPGQRAQRAGDLPTYLVLWGAAEERGEGENVYQELAETQELQFSVPSYGREGWHSGC